MGIYDREYIRGESSGVGLFGGDAPVTKAVIVISFVVFFLENLLQWDSKGITAQWLAASPDLTFHAFRLYQLVTAAFVHMPPQGLFSVVFDMWFFWFIGRDMESLYGSRDFLIFFILSTLLTTLAGLAVASAWHLDRALIYGSWGPILATMTLFTLYYPRREILFFFIIPMPMWVLLGIYILLPLLTHFSGVNVPGIGVAMVLTGAGFAYAYKHLDLRWSRLIAGRRFRPRLRIFTAGGYEPPARPRNWTPSRPASSVGVGGGGTGTGGRAPAVSVLPEEQLDARVDEILAKIARDGNRDSLTEDEQRILQEASRRARIRRSDRI